MDFNAWVQSRLTAHGYPVGPVDGVIGATTTEAIKRFQTARLLAITGVADKATVEALRATSSFVPPVVKTQIPDRDALPVANEPGPVFANRWPRQADCMAFYGPVGTSQTTIEIPFDMFLAWDRGTRARKMTLHTKVAASAERVLHKVAAIYSADERKAIGLDIFGGSLNVRKMRGGSAYSMHSWGIAIDFDPERNQLHWGADKARLAKDDAKPFWQAWEAEGWLSLGRARDFDWQHIQAARL